AAACHPSPAASVAAPCPAAPASATGAMGGLARRGGCGRSSRDFAGTSSQPPDPATTSAGWEALHRRAGRIATQQCTGWMFTNRRLADDRAKGWRPRPVRATSARQLIARARALADLRQKAALGQRDEVLGRGRWRDDADLAVRALADRAVAQQVRDQ